MDNVKNCLSYTNIHPGNFSSFRSILILVYHLHLGLPRVHLTWDFRHIVCMHSSSLYSCRMPYRFIRFVWMALKCEAKQENYEESLRTILKHPVASSVTSRHLGSGIFASNESCSVNVWALFSHLHETTSQIVRFQVFTVVTMKNCVFCDITPSFFAACVGC
jgi:hypothetical protein